MPAIFAGKYAGRPHHSALLSMYFLSRNKIRIIEIWHIFSFYK